MLVLAVLGALGSVLYQGMVVEAAADMLDGRRDQTIGSLLGGAAPVVVPLLVAGILVGLATALGLILLIVGAFLVATIFAVTAPAIVIERLGPIQGMKRSVDLVKNQFLPALGVLVVVLLINYVAGYVLQLIFGAIDDGVLGYSLGSLISQVLLAPITALAASYLYFDLSGYRGPAGGSSPASSVASPHRSLRSRAQPGPPTAPLPPSSPAEDAPCACSTWSTRTAPDRASSPR